MTAVRVLARAILGSSEGFQEKFQTFPVRKRDKSRDLERFAVQWNGEPL